MSFKRILSRASLKSSSSGKSIAAEEERNKLIADIEKLKQTVDSLKHNKENRDEAIGVLAREKEKTYVELKSVQRTNRNLHQQIQDERDMHAKEKEFLLNEIKRITKNKHDVNQNKLLEDLERNNLLDAEIKAKDEIIFKVCEKYLKMKSSKIILEKKLKKLKKFQERCQVACGSILILLQDNRKIIKNLLNKIIESTNTSISNKNFYTNYLRLLKTNACLHYENTQLKVRISLFNPCPTDIFMNRKKQENKQNNKIRNKGSKSDVTMKNCIRAEMENLYFNRHCYRNYSEHSYKNYRYMLPKHSLHRSKSDSYITRKTYK